MIITDPKTADIVSITKDWLVHGSYEIHQKLTQSDWNCIEDDAVTGQQMREYMAGTHTGEHIIDC